MRVVIDLSEDDLEHFRAARRRAKAAAQDLTPEQITGAAQKLLEDTEGQQVPEFVSSRMKRTRPANAAAAVPPETKTRLSGRGAAFSGSTIFAMTSRVVRGA